MSDYEQAVQKFYSDSYPAPKLHSAMTLNHTEVEQIVRAEYELRDRCTITDERWQSMLEGPNAHLITNKIEFATTCFNAGQQAASQWIPTSERLPESFATVLIATEFGVETAFRGVGGLFIGDEGRMLKASHVTHWMPIPPLPTQPQEEKS